jgi:hypothetical protein
MPKSMGSRQAAGWEEHGDKDDEHLTGEHSTRLGLAVMFDRLWLRSSSVDVADNLAWVHSIAASNSSNGTVAKLEAESLMA